MIEGSKEHTQEVYKFLRFTKRATTMEIISFFEWLKKEGKLHHLENYEGLTIMETKIIEDMLKNN